MKRDADQSSLIVLARDGAKRDRASGKSRMPTLVRVARDTLQEQAYLRLREALMSGHFVPGRLEVEHALVPRWNRTLGVPEMTYASSTELREVRMALEGLAAEKAALLVTADEVTVVESHYQAISAGASAGNPGAHLLVSLIEPTWTRLGPYVRLMLPDRRALMDSLRNSPGSPAGAAEARRYRRARGNPTRHL